MGVDFKPARDAGWVGLVALTVLFGMQTLRTLVPLAVFVLRDRFGWHAGAVGLAMLAVLATGFLAAPVARALGSRRFLWIAVGGLGLTRLELQLWTGDPRVDLGLAVIASILFFFVLPALAALGRRRFVFGWLIGLAIDTSLHGAYGTWDMIWRSDLATLLTILGLVGLQWFLLASAGPVERQAEDSEMTSGWVWTALGPLLLLELLVLGNVARLATLTDWPLEAAALWALAGRILACAAVSLAVARERLDWPVTAGVAGVFLASFSVTWPRGVPAALLLLAGQALAALLWTRIVVAGGNDRPRGLAGSHGFALLAFGVLLFLYYGGIDIRLPFSKDVLPPVAAMALGACAVAAARSPSAGSSAKHSAGFGVSWLALTILLVPGLIRLGSTGEDHSSNASGLPLRIMTYNVHLGIDPQGHLGLEHIASIIEAESPDVVALQEVSRGWVIGGSADVLAWLSRRLDMPYIFAPTADPLWGNAVLSKRPIEDFQAVDLPTEDLLIRRGILSVQVDLGDEEPLEVIVTHHHHPRDGGAVRELQSRALLDFWRSTRGEGERGRTVLLGDFNARPGEPEIEVLRDAGFADVLDLADVEPGYTNPATHPSQRIDYVWISPDLTARNVAVPPDLASDHLPVVATVNFR